jgi:predicted XRE-type DNA-binding protein
MQSLQFFGLIYISVDILEGMKKDQGKKVSAGVKKKRAAAPKPGMNLRIREVLMRRIAGIIADSEWTQTEAAERCGVTQPRINDLVRGRSARFSLDALVNIAAGLGQKVTLKVEDLR